jgi:hypothetical protein
VAGNVEAITQLVCGHSSAPSSSPPRRIRVQVHGQTSRWFLPTTATDAPSTVLSYIEEIQPPWPLLPNYNPNAHTHTHTSPSPAVAGATTSDATNAMRVTMSNPWPDPVGSRKLSFRCTLPPFLHTGDPTSLAALTKLQTQCTHTSAHTLVSSFFCCCCCCCCCHYL